MKREIDRDIMNKLIQSIIISAVVIAPLSSLSLMAEATTHHTQSHVSTMSLETTRTRRKTKKVKKFRKQANIKAKKQVTKRYKKKAVSTKETMTPSSKPENPTIPQTIPVPPTLPTPSTSPESSAPNPPLKSTLDPKNGNPMTKPSTDVVLPNPADGTPIIPVFSPGSIPNPSGDTSIPNPKFPTVLPSGSIK
jgi:hypothetical protein